MHTWMKAVANNSHSTNYTQYTQYTCITYDVARERLLNGLPVLGKQALGGREVDGLLHATVTNLYT